uniref:Uncharacterized protein n=1 Tax=Avena sativa TaxID=4498 RepID=A0ACD6AJZ2_AVESA
MAASGVVSRDTSIPSWSNSSLCSAMDTGLCCQDDTPDTQTEPSFSVAAAAEMAGRQLYDHGSPGSASSTSNHLHTLARDTPRVINIPFRMLLDLMLQELGISKAEYHLELCDDGEVRVTVQFNTSTLPAEGSPVYISVAGIKSRSYEEAEDSACANAITHVSQATNTIVRDLGYGRLLEVEEINKCLLRKLKKAHEYKKKLARGWFLAVRHMSSFSEQILSITALNHSQGQDQFVVAWNGLLYNFYNMAHRLKHAGAVLEKHLENMRRNQFS